MIKAIYSIVAAAIIATGVTLIIADTLGNLAQIMETL